MPDDRRCSTPSASSQRLGMLGDRPVAEVIEHAAAFVDALARRSRGRSSTSAAAAGCPVWSSPAPDPTCASCSSTGAPRAPITSAASSGASVSSDRVDGAHGRRRRAADDPAGPVDAVVARGFGPPAETLPSGRSPARRRWPDGRQRAAAARRPAAGRTASCATSASRAIAHDDRRVACFRRLDVSRGTRGRAGSATSLFHVKHRPRRRGCLTRPRPARQAVRAARPGPLCPTERPARDEPARGQPARRRRRAATSRRRRSPLVVRSPA